MLCQANAVDTIAITTKKEMCHHQPTLNKLIQLDLLHKGVAKTFKLTQLESITSTETGAGRSFILIKQKRIWIARVKPSVIE